MRQGTAAAVRMRGAMRWMSGGTSRAKAVVLLSGGLDSATALAEAKASGFETYALTISTDSGMPSSGTPRGRVASALGVARHVEQTLDLRTLRRQRVDRRDRRAEGPRRNRRWRRAFRSPTSPRGTRFSSRWRSHGRKPSAAFDLFVGVNCVDYSGYPDCRPEFLRAFETLANLATKAGVEGTGRFRVHAPLLTLTKDQIILRGNELGVDYGLTHSCYDPTRRRPRVWALRFVRASVRGIRETRSHRSRGLRAVVTDQTAAPWLQFRIPLGRSGRSQSRQSPRARRWRPDCAVIFDIDGTLINSVDAHARAWQEVFAEYGVRVAFEEVRHQIGKGGDQLMPIFLPARARSGARERD